MRFDLSNRNLQKIVPDILKENLQFLTSSCDDELVDEKNVESALFDNNCLSKLDSLDIFLNLKHLSLTNNRLVEIKAIGKLQHLEFVNLLNNSLTNLNPFKELKNLKWINVSGNQISCLEPLNSNSGLEYIDASNNEISTTGNLTNLDQLVTLNLNGNEIYELSTMPSCLNPNLHCLLLSHNVIEDLNQICYLANLDKLESLSIDDNPCTTYTNEGMFDYRPFVINWCMSLLKLDGTQVNQKEYLKAEWLYSQGKGRHFRPGQSQQLVEYLIKSCPYTGRQSVEEEVRLSKILEKKATYASEAVTGEHWTALERNLLTASKELISNLIVNTDTYEKKIETLNYKEFMHSLSSNSESEKQNLIDHINLSTSDYGNNGNLDQDILSDKNTENKMNHSPAKYKDYDNRPIQPLDRKKLNEKLTEYPEMSPEELEELKARTAQHIRSKTSDPATSHRQSLRNQQPNNAIRNVNRSPMTRQLSFNSNRTTASHIPKKPAATTTTTANNPTKPSFSYLTKRSKTENELHIKPKPGPVSTPTKSKLKYNPTNYSPLKQPAASSYLRQVSHPKIEIAKPGPLTTPRKTNNNSVVRPACLSSQTRAISTDNVCSPSLLKDTRKELKKSEASLVAATSKDQLKHSEIHSKIQRQRQEMLLNKQRNLNEFRNQLKLEHEKSIQQRQCLNESFTKINSIKKTRFSFEDTCAVKIQSLWRGYRLRKALSAKKSHKPTENYQNLLDCVRGLRTDLASLTNEHKSLVKFYNEDCLKLKRAVLCLASSIGPKESQTNATTSTRASLNNELFIENKVLKQKIAYLEDKYAQLEAKAAINETEATDANTTHHSNVTTSTAVAPRLEIHPPIRVRLQKLNEKRVALKWNHNPLNNLTEIHGYHIYINGKLCGKMSPNDMVASINGIQEEGEYRIFIRSFFRAVESVDSNEVVTRVKRKPASEPNDEGNNASKSNDTGSLTSNSNDSSTASSSTSCERKEFLDLMKERLSGIVDDKPVQRPAENIANRIARNPIPASKHQYGFLAESEYKRIGDTSSDNSITETETSQPFGRVSNKLNANKANVNPVLKQSAGEDIENDSSRSEVAYLSNMRPVSEVVKRSSLL